ncbi:MAG: hypothetical protein LBU34_03805 [Planctomycetaceae bacterium]|jgi:hypothetical protein|nr:hypothetical protein [Planctomycetaceae bacterium]
MKQNTLLVILLFIVFFIGFLSGSLWQTLLQNQLRIVTEPSVAPVVSPASTVVMENTNTKNMDTATPQKLTEDEQVTQALTDPDFKRVHDFLIREYPIQMNLENKDK